MGRRNDDSSGQWTTDFSDDFQSFTSDHRARVVRGPRSMERMCAIDHPPRLCS